VIKLNDLLLEFLDESGLQLEFIDGFDLEKFKAMRSYAEKIRYANTNLTRLASGSSRIVYKIDDKRVLKLAKNPKGLDQNGAEADWYVNQNFGDIISKVLESDDDDRWVVSEYARKITKSRFKQLLGVPIEQFYAWLIKYHGRKSIWDPELDPKVNEYLDENEFAEQLSQLVGEMDIQIGDFGRISSYGEIDGRLVITDYGLTRNVWDTHYNPETKQKKNYGRY
jgi:hypothetical protein